MSYPVGTICIGQNFVRDVRRNGCQCEVVEFIAEGRVLCELNGEIADAPLYVVQFEGDDFTSTCKPHHLRRKSDDDHAKNKISELIKDCTDWAKRELECEGR